MLVLALDTTTRAGSAALVENDRVIAERVGNASRAHAERLPGDLMDLLRDAGRGLSEVDLFAVAAGPGSFTGLRIGIATIQGLAVITARRIVALSALETLAQAAGRDLAPGAIVAAWMDGYRRDVFSALYRVTDAPAYAPEHLDEIDPAAAGDPVSTLTRWKDRTPAVLIGEGAVAHRHLCESSARVIDAPPLAATLGRMAIVRGQRGLSVEPGRVQPFYVRRPDVEVERERQRATPDPPRTPAAKMVRGAAREE